MLWHVISLPYGLRHLCWEINFMCLVLLKVLHFWLLLRDASSPLIFQLCTVMCSRAVFFESSCLGRGAASWWQDLILHQFWRIAGHSLFITLAAFPVSPRALPFHQALTSQTLFFILFRCPCFAVYFLLSYGPGYWSFLQLCLICY